MNEFVDLLPAQQRTDDESWYRGTADAVYQNQDILASYGADYIVVLAGDHIYKMNYALMLADHVAKGRDCTVGCIAVPRMEATAFGVMAVDEKDLIVDFVEKPADPPAMPNDPDRALASMGIYIFNARFLYKELERDINDPRFEPRLRQGHHPARREERQRGGASVRAERRRHPRQRGAVLARRGNDRRVLGRQHRPDRNRPVAQPLRSPLADLDVSSPAAAGQVRAQPGRPARHGDRVGGVGRMHRLGQRAPLGAVLERAGAFALGRELVGAATRRADRPARAAHDPLRHRSRLHDSRRHGHRKTTSRSTAQRFYRSENGITLVTREMLDKLQS